MKLPATPTVVRHCFGTHGEWFEVHSDIKGEATQADMFCALGKWCAEHPDMCVGAVNIHFDEYGEPYRLSVLVDVGDNAPEKIPAFVTGRQKRTENGTELP